MTKETAINLLDCINEITTCVVVKDGKLGKYVKALTTIKSELSEVIAEYEHQENEEREANALYNVFDEEPENIDYLPLFRSLNPTF
jgi:hypothetical protein